MARGTAVFAGKASLKLPLVGLLLVLFVALGCGEKGQGPTTTDFTQKRAALNSKMDARKERRARAEKIGQGEPVKVAKGKASGDSGFASIDKEYTYDPTGKRDPFRNFKWDRPDRIREREAAGPLEQFDLSQLSLVAVVWNTGNARALVQDPSGESYIVAEGARIGKNEGIVTLIDDSLMRVKETYVDFLGRETTKDIELRMRRNEGG